MRPWGNGRRGRFGWWWSLPDIPRPMIGWYWRGGEDDPVGTLAIDLGDSGGDAIVGVAVEFAAPRWAHGVLGVLAR